MFGLKDEIKRRMMCRPAELDEPFVRLVPEGLAATSSICFALGIYTGGKHTKIYVSRGSIEALEKDEASVNAWRVFLKKLAGETAAGEGEGSSGGVRTMGDDEMVALVRTAVKNSNKAEFLRCE